MITATPKTGFVVLGNQLFPMELLAQYRDACIYMAEDEGLCTFVRHHKQKIVLFLASMRSYRDELRKRGFNVTYNELADAVESDSYEEKLRRWVQANDIDELIMWEVEDKFFEQRLQSFASEQGIRLRFLDSPMFVTSRADFSEWLEHHRAHMADFYRWQRQRLGILLNLDGTPRGGRWSFDTENRKALPAKLPIPLLGTAPITPHVLDVIEIVNTRFADHPGQLDSASWWLPTTREHALEWLEQFLEERFELFGPYEDALSQRDPFLFHSVLTPSLNLGLITPAEVIERTLDVAAEHDVSLASVEGFVRQVIGWREFVHGMYRERSERQEQSNYFNHRRKLTSDWYAGTTGMLHFDAVAKKAQRWGWTHHIERLMVIGNLMTLAEIDPREAYRFFMEMYVDSSDWVMAPNVYGMGLFADGGSFATKPYICSSNYILKMSDYRKPKANERGNWCDTLDGLYWRFIDKHRVFFAGQPRLSRTVQLLNRLNKERKQRIFNAAEEFLESRTS